LPFETIFVQKDSGFVCRDGQDEMRQQMEQEEANRSSGVGKNVRINDSEGRKKVEQEKKLSFGQRWDKARAAKKVVFWAIIGAVIVTVIVGFGFGGWVTSGAAQKLTDDAITQRLASICVGQFDQDLQKDQKLIELKDTSSYQRDDYVTEQGWATMPGEAETDNEVASGCAKLIVKANSQ